ncbi:MAG TPA: EMC3/TMCO1 family protein [Candidatus Nanoarchaeia archaeon]|nr:EMC3/TMCO1 family protein [Candidatus Nanoarchaeia archaeon]
MVLEGFFNSVFGPLLKFHPFILTFIVSVIMTLIVTLIQRFTTNQKEMKLLKEQQTYFQKEMKENKSNPEKLVELQKQAMGVSMKYMRHSMRSTIFTILPVILIFGWMNSALSFDVIHPGEEFTMTATFTDAAQGEATLSNYEGMEIISNATVSVNAAKWTLKAKDSGTYPVELSFNDNVFAHEVIVSDKNVPKEMVKSFKGQALKALRIDYPKLVVLPIIKFGWLGTYIILSILLSAPIRKLIKVY